MPNGLKVRKEQQCGKVVTHYELHPGKNDIGNKDCMVSLIPNGKLTYLWIGDERECRFTISGVAAMRQWAKALLKALPKEKP